MTTLKVPAVVKLKENVIDEIYNFSPADAPLVSMIPTEKVHNVYFEWQRDIYRAANKDNAALEGADASPAAITQPGLLNNRTQIFNFGYYRSRQEVWPCGRKSPQADEGCR